MAELSKSTDSSTHESDEPVTSLEDNYKQIYERGKLVYLHIARWGMATQLKPADLGLAENPHKFFKLGRKHLIKESVSNMFDRLEGKARGRLERVSFHFAMVPTAHFVPRKELASLLKDLDKLKGEYESLRDQFIANYEGYKEETMQENEDIRDKLQNCYPTLDYIRQSFAFQITVFEIVAPKDLGEHSYEEELRKLEFEETAKEAAIEEHRVRLATQKQAHTEALNQFLNTSLASLRVMVTEAATSVRDRIISGENVNNRQLTVLRDMITKVRALNFADETELSTCLDTLEQYVDNTSFKGDDSEQSIQSLSDHLSGIINRGFASQLTVESFSPTRKIRIT